MMTDFNFDVTLMQRGDFEFAVSFDAAGQPQLTMDEPEPLGADRGPNAARVLGAAVGHCLSASLIFCLRKARIQVHGVETRVHGTIGRNDRNRLRITEIQVELRPQVAEGDRDRMARCLEVFEDFCIVTASVRKVIPIKVTVIPEDIREPVVSV